MEQYREALSRQNGPQIVAERVFRSLRDGRKDEERILETFPPEAQREIRSRLAILSSLAHFIGKDFDMPVVLNEPEAGWHWDFSANVIKVDPVDLLEKDMDYLRFVICHEGGHRRISRTEFIPLEEWNQPGFAFMMNAIEDPRDNNFVAESYPKFREHMALAYQEDLDFEAKAKDRAGKKLGRQPRFMQAGFEYIKQWFREVQELEPQIDPALPDDVRRVVAATLESARDSWWRYPSRAEADSGEVAISKYAKVSYEINRDEVWPEYKKLIEEDIKDQELQEAIQKMQDKGKPSIPKSLKDQLTPPEQKALEQAIEQTLSQEAGSSDKEPSQMKPVDPSQLPEELKQKIKDFIDSLPPEVKRSLEEAAKQAIKEFEGELNKELEGKMASNPERKAEADAKDPVEEPAKAATVSAGQRAVTSSSGKQSTKVLGERVFSEKLAQMERGENMYERFRRELLPLIDWLEAELRQIFVQRKVTVWKGGFKSGRRVDIERRIQEKVKAIPTVESRAWRKREVPEEKDYAISLLVDVSGSMHWDDKSEGALKSIIVLAEALNRLGLRVEVLGFSDELKEYQKFGETMSNHTREQIGEMMNDTATKRCNACHMDHNGTDIGWATHVAAERLAREEADQKILITLSDYQLEESPKHSSREYELGRMIGDVLKMGDIKMIGFGIGGDADAVEGFYPHSIANVPVQETAKRLAQVIKDAIEHSDSFS